MSGQTWGEFKGKINGFRFENSEQKRLGPSIGRAATGSQSEIDRDSDGVVLDGTPDEKPAPKKPVSKESTSGYKPGYILEDADGQLQQYDGQPPKDKPYIREQMNGQLQEFNAPPKKPVNNKPPDRYPNPPKKPVTNTDDDYDGMINDGTSEERRAPYKKQSNAEYEKARRRFVRAELARQGIKRNARVQDRSKEERDARAKARAAFDKATVRAGAEAQAGIGRANSDAARDRRLQAESDRLTGQAARTSAADRKPADRYPNPDKKYPPGQKPSAPKPADKKPADRYPNPTRPDRKPADRYPNPEKKYPPGQKPSAQKPADRKPADRYPNPPKKYPPGQKP